MKTDLTTASHLTELQARLLIAELVRLGLKHLCIAPGSRSSALVIAAYQHPQLTLHVHFDERGLGFFALGLSKAFAAPVAVLTTSGSAVANLVPAAVEAWQETIPLLWLTADRPPELHHCAANQTIEQPPLLASLVCHQHDLPVAELGYPLSHLLSSLDNAWYQLARGPVHINIAMREPLYPTQAQPDWQALLAPITRWLTSDQPWQQQSPPTPLAAPETTQWQQFCTGKGIIVAGELTPAEATAVAALQRQLGWPLLVDIQSQLAGVANTIPGDRALRADAIKQQLAAADRVLWFGDKLLSKPWLQWLTQHPWTQSWQVCRHHGRRDANVPITHAFTAPVDQWLATLPNPAPAPWADALQTHLPALPAALSDVQQPLCELAVMAQLGQWLPHASTLFIGNSLPVRLLDSVGDWPQPPTVYTNRGASGIDGIIATASGLCCGQNQPVTLVIGDQSLLHDLNSLALAPTMDLPLVILLINNGGGNIFDIMPLADAQLKERYFRAQHRLIFNNISAQFAWHYNQPSTLIELRTVYQQALCRAQPTLIEVKTTPGEAVSAWQQLWA